MKKAAKNGKKNIKINEDEFEYESDDSNYNEDDEFKIPENMWIIKPGENTNRGNGI